MAVHSVIRAGLVGTLVMCGGCIIHHGSDDDCGYDGYDTSCGDGCDCWDDCESDDCDERCSGECERNLPPPSTAPRSPPGGVCRFHQDCQTGALCVDGTCRARCATPAECLPSETCSAGVCSRVPAEACVTDGGCPVGYACLDGFCAASCSTASHSFVYLVSKQADLYAFDPLADETTAVRWIGRLDCQTTGRPQSMAVDRTGLAWVFYDSSELFQVSTTSGRCRATGYRHPVREDFNRLGMSFTGSNPETLYIVSPEFGLATVDTRSLAVTLRHTLAGSPAELAGGPDGKLFVWVADRNSLAELDVVTLASRPVSHIPFLQGTYAWAFAREGNEFFLFSATDEEPSSTLTVYEMATGQAYVRDYLGFVVVGAGRSMCGR